MGDVRTCEDYGPGGDLVSADAIGCDRAPGDDPGRWVETHRFLDHLFGVGESGQVVETRRASVQHLGQFVTKLPRHRRVFG